MDNFMQMYKTYLDELGGLPELFKYELDEGPKENTNIENQYMNNKSADTGEDIRCPMCGKVFTKKQYSQAFCSTHCKDDYWNLKRGKKEPVEVKYSSNVVETEIKELLAR